jgi:hypothetical protein
MKVTGGCHCGQITYEAEVDPATVRVCHCTDCQRLSGAVFRTNISSLPGTFVLKSGTRRFTSRPPKAETSEHTPFVPNAVHQFMPPCRGQTLRRSGCALAVSTSVRSLVHRRGKVGAARPCLGQWTSQAWSGQIDNFDRSQQSGTEAKHKEAPVAAGVHRLRLSGRDLLSLDDPAAAASVARSCTGSEGR